MNKKRCTLCKIEKFLEDFPKQRNQPDGHSCWCKPCHCAKSKAWRERNPEKAKETQKAYQLRNPRRYRQDTLRKKYGMELEDYERLLSDQDGVCAICKLRAVADSNKDYLCVDHIEGTLEVRGLLCSPCNSAIGFLDHDPQRLYAAIEYLLRSPVFVGKKVPHGIHRSRAALCRRLWVSA